MADLNVQTITDIATFKEITFEQAQSLCQNSDSTELANLIAQAQNFKETGVRNFVQNNTKYDGSQLFNYGLTTDYTTFERTVPSNYVETNPEPLVIDKNKVIAYDLKKIDNDFDDWSGNELKKQLSKINKDNVVDVLNEYDKISKDGKSLTDYITGLSKMNTNDKTKKEFINVIYNALIQKCEELGVDVTNFQQEYAQIMAKKSTVQSMDGYSAGTTQTDTISNTDAKSLDILIRSIKTTIENAPKVATLEETTNAETGPVMSEIMTQTGKQETIDLLRDRSRVMGEELQQQKDYDGWAGKTADAVSILWGSENRASVVQSDLDAHNQMIDKLQIAQNSDLEIKPLLDEAENIEKFITAVGKKYENMTDAEQQEADAKINKMIEEYTLKYEALQEKVKSEPVSENFEKEFEKEYGIKYDANKVELSIQQEQKLVMAQSVASVEYAFNKEFADMLTDKPLASTEVPMIYDSSKPRPQAQTTKQYTYLAEQEKFAKYLGGDDQNKGYELINKAFKDAKLPEDASYDEKYEVLRKMAKTQSKSLHNLVSEFTDGLGIDGYKKKADDYYYAAFGTKNDLARKVSEYNHSQQVGAGAVKMGVNIGLIIASGLIPGGQGASGTLLTNLVTNVARSFATGFTATAITEGSDVLTSKSRTLEDEAGNILTASLHSGASLAIFAGASGLANLAFTPIKAGANGSAVMANASKGAAPKLTHSAFNIATNQTVGKIASEAAPLLTGGIMKYIEEGEFTLKGQAESVAMLMAFKAMNHLQTKVQTNIKNKIEAEKLMQQNTQMAREFLKIKDVDILKESTIEAQYAYMKEVATSKGAPKEVMEILEVSYKTLHTSLKQGKVGSYPKYTMFEKAPTVVDMGYAEVIEPAKITTGSNGANSTDGKASNMPATEKTAPQAKSTETKAQKALPEGKPVEVKAKANEEISARRQENVNKEMEINNPRVKIKSSVANEEVLGTEMPTKPIQGIEPLKKANLSKGVETDYMTAATKGFVLTEIEALPQEKCVEILNDLRFEKDQISSIDLSNINVRKTTNIFHILKKTDFLDIIPELNTPEGRAELLEYFKSPDTLTEIINETKYVNEHNLELMKNIIIGDNSKILNLISGDIDITGISNALSIVTKNYTRNVSIENIENLRWYSTENFQLVTPERIAIIDKINDSVPEEYHIKYDDISRIGEIDQLTTDAVNSYIKEIRRYAKRGLQCETSFTNVSDSTNELKLVNEMLDQFPMDLTCAEGNIEFYMLSKISQSNEIDEIQEFVSMLTPEAKSSAIHYLYRDNSPIDVPKKILAQAYNIINSENYKLKDAETYTYALEKMVELGHTDYDGYLKWIEALNGTKDYYSGYHDSKYVTNGDYKGAAELITKIKDMPNIDRYHNANSQVLNRLNDNPELDYSTVSECVDYVVDANLVELKFNIEEILYDPNWKEQKVKLEFLKEIGFVNFSDIKGTINKIKINNNGTMTLADKVDIISICTQKDIELTDRNTELIEYLIETPNFPKKDIIKLEYIESFETAKAKLEIAKYIDSLDDFPAEYKIDVINNTHKYTFELIKRAIDDTTISYEDITKFSLSLYSYQNNPNGSLLKIQLDMFDHLSQNKVSSADKISILNVVYEDNFDAILTGVSDPTFPNADVCKLQGNIHTPMYEYLTTINDISQERKIFLLNNTNEDNFEFNKLLVTENSLSDESVRDLLYNTSKNEVASKMQIYNVLKDGTDDLKRCMYYILNNTRAKNIEFARTLISDKIVSVDSISQILYSTINNDTEAKTNIYNVLKTNKDISNDLIVKILLATNNENIELVSKLCLDPEFTQKELIADTTRATNKDNIELVDKLCFDPKFPNELIAEIGRTINKDNIELSEELCFDKEFTQKDRIVDIIRNPLGCSLAKYRNAENIQSLSKTEKRDFLLQLLINKDYVSKSSDVKDLIPLIPTNDVEYEAMIEKITQSLNFSFKQLNNNELKEFDTSLNSIKGIKNMNLKSLTQVELSTSHQDFISQVTNLIKDLPQTEQIKIQDYYGFQIKDGKLIGYPNTEAKDLELAEISDTKTIEVVSNMKSIVENYTDNNFITTKDNPQLNQMLKDISKYIPEIFNQIDRSSTFVDTIKSLQKVVQNSKFEILSSSDQKVMLLSTLLHNTDKISGSTSESAFDAYFIAKKFNISDKEAQKIYKVVESADIIDKFMKTSKTETVRNYRGTYINGQQRQDTFDLLAFNLKEGNDFELAQMLYSTKETDGLTRNLDKVLQDRIQEITSQDLILPQTKAETYHKLATEQDIKGHKVKVVNASDIEDFNAFVHTPEAGCATGGSRMANFANFEIFKNFADDKVVCMSYLGKDAYGTIGNKDGFIFDVDNNKQYVAFGKDIFSLGKNIPDILVEYYRDRGFTANKHRGEKYAHRTMVSNVLKSILYKQGDFYQISKNVDATNLKYNSQIDNLYQQIKAMVKDKTKAEIETIHQTPKYINITKQMNELRSQHGAELTKSEDYQKIREINKKYVERMENVKLQLGDETMTMERLQEIDPELASAYKEFLARRPQNSEESISLLRDNWHNECLVSNPEITAIYTHDTSKLPEEYLIKAQEENLPIVVLK
ncbi:MAG: hypothetical protein R3Y28_03940 [Candidatus Gastranaerophilales bacterium]